jgi:hypothetical protein
MFHEGKTRQARQFAIGRNRDALCLREELDAPAHVPSRIALVQLPNHCRCSMAAFVRAGRNSRLNQISISAIYDAVAIAG